MQMVGKVLHAGHSDRHKANIDYEQNGGEDQGEPSKEQCADPKTAVFVERRGSCADHYKEGKAAEYRVQDQWDSEGVVERVG